MFKACPRHAFPWTMSVAQYVLLCLACQSYLAFNPPKIQGGEGRDWLWCLPASEPRHKSLDSPGWELNASTVLDCITHRNSVYMRQTDSKHTFRVPHWDWSGKAIHFGAPFSDPEELECFCPNISPIDRPYI